MQELIDVTKSPVIDVLPILLQDKTTNKNIIWATDAYSKIDEKSEMSVNAILNRPEIICPRVFKSKAEQIARSRKKAEVFTPAWLVNKMNNFLDEDWFERKNVFNTENNDNTWTSTKDAVEFTEEKTYNDYINSKRLEITCGEAPYLVTRYDAVTGKFIPVKNRVGILDRKIKIVNQNAAELNDWVNLATYAFKSVYGYEYQGDNTLIARINLLMSFVEYYEEKFGIQPKLDIVENIAEIIAKNIWQMDGLKDNKPLGAPYKQYIQPSLFDCNEQTAVDIPSKIFDYEENKYIFFLELKEMKSVGKKLFDYVIGNPPYQENISNNEGNESLSKQLFPTFVKEAIKTGSIVELITPSRWFTADAQDKSFIKLREFAKKNNHFKTIVHYPNTKDVFPNVELTGGVNYFVYDPKFNGDVKFIEVDKNSSSTVTRPLFEADLDIILSMNSFVTIIRKILDNENFVSLTTITQGRNAFGVIGKKTELEKITEDTMFDGAYEVRCAHESIRYIKPSLIEKNIEIAKNWKIFISKGNGGAGLINNEKAVAVIGKAYIGKPNSICTDSLIPIGCFQSEEEAVALQKYLATKFARLLIGILKVSQNITQVVYKFVPLQDFTQNSDIDWTKSVAEIDRMLYKKYGLSEEEIEFIETHVKEMA